MAQGMTQADMRQYAVAGARARLEALRAEEAAIVQAFPELGGGRARKAVSAAASAAKTGRKKRSMSAAMRKEVSERMKKYWAARRKAAARG